MNTTEPSKQNTYVAIVLIVFGVMYLFFSFVNLNLAFWQWHVITRSAYVFMSILASFLTLLIFNDSI